MPSSRSGRLMSRHASTNPPSSAADVGREGWPFHEGERAARRDRILKLLRRTDLKQAARYVLDRSRKWLRQRRHVHPIEGKRPVFVVGCNRSGTNMVCKAIGRSSRGWDFPERQSSVAFKAYYLRADSTIERLIRLTPARVVCFGSILDSQFTDHLLSRFDGARAIWIYRRYQDVANSCGHMQWGPQLKDLMRWVAHGQTERLGSRGKRIAPETVELFGRLYREDLSVEEGACLYWYLRNRLYFDLGLHQDPRVLLAQYEDAVVNTENVFRGIFGFVGLPFDPDVTDGIYASSVGRYPRPGIDPEIGRVCESLQAELDDRYVELRNRASSPDGPETRA